MLEPWEGGRRTVDGFRVVAGVAVLLARVCVGTRLTFCVRCPSEEVGLTAGRGFVVVVDGGYREDSFLDASVCLTDAVRPSPPGFALLLVLDDVVVVVDMLRVGGFTGRRLGEPWRGSGAALLLLEVEEALADVPEDVELGFLRERERARDVDIAALLTRRGLKLVVCT